MQHEWFVTVTMKDGADVQFSVHLDSDGMYYQQLKRAGDMAVLDAIEQGYQPASFEIDLEGMLFAQLERVEELDGCINEMLDCYTEANSGYPYIPYDDASEIAARYGYKP